jgi:hypothetical protein
MSPRLFGALAVGAAVVPGAAAQAQQGSATVRETIRVVRTTAAAPANSLVEARVGQALRSGDRVRTAGRSYAGIRFQDRSTLRMGELSEVLVGGGQQSTRVLRGRIFANLKNPGTISGGYAVAAVRGTELEYIVDESKKGAIVNCYEGRVFVGGPKNPMVTGVAGEVTPSTVSLPGLIGTDTAWTSGSVRFTDGPFRGQTRLIRSVDPATGTVTLDRPLPVAFAPGAGTSGVLIAAQANGPVVELTPNTGTFVGANGVPTPPRQIPTKQFANLNRSSINRILDSGGNSDTFVGSEMHVDVRREEAGQEGALRNFDDTRFFQGSPPPECGCGDFFPDAGGTPTGKRAKGRVRAASLLAPRGGQLVGSGFSGALGPQLAFGGGSQQRGDLGTSYIPEIRTMPQTVRTMPNQPGDTTAFLIEPFGFATDDGQAIGSRFRVVTSVGEVFFEAGYRYLLADGQSRHNVSEASLSVRGKNGDVTLGRQHLFIRPVNNNDVGTLLGLDTTDGIVYELKPKNGRRLQMGYLTNTRATRTAGEKGGFIRGQNRVARGAVGYSLFLPQDDGRNIGYSIDFQQPLIRNVIDVYGELGASTTNRRLTTFGIYLPGIYQATNTDVFVEYGLRARVQEALSLRLRRTVAKGLVLIGLIDGSLRDSGFTGGGGFLYTTRWK